MGTGGGIGEIEELEKGWVGCGGEGRERKGSLPVRAIEVHMFLGVC